INRIPKLRTSPVWKRVKLGVGLRARLKYLQKSVDKSSTAPASSDNSDADDDAATVTASTPTPAASLKRHASVPLRKFRPPGLVRANTNAALLTHLLSDDDPHNQL